MTCIVGLVHNGEVYIGGDSAGVAGYSIRNRSDSKVFKNREFIFGFTTSFRMGQILRYTFSPPIIDNNKDLMDYMVNDFVNGVRSVLKSSGYAKRKDDNEIGGNFLVGVRGRLFEINDDYQVGECIENYNTVGCGHDLALGSLYTTQALDNIKDDPVYRIKLALMAASNFSAGVNGPFVIISETQLTPHILED